MNLIICATPLHILIAERIIEQNPKEDYFILTYLNTDNPKTLYYHEQLKKKNAEEVLLSLNLTRKEELMPTLIY